MNFYLMPSIEFGPAVVEKMVSRLSPEDFDRRTDPDRFTVREAIAHLADWEPIMRDRLRLGVENSGSNCVTYDEGDRAIELNYAATDPQEQAKLFREERAKTAGYLRTLKAEDWPKHIVHPERGRLSVEDVANMLLGHDLYHLEHLAQYL